MELSKGSFLRERSKKLFTLGLEFSPPKDKDQRNFTDPESRILLNSEKAFAQGYTAQATVDVESQIIVAADLTNEANDKRQLEPQMEQVIQNTGRTPKEMSADTGYYSDDNLEYLRKRRSKVLSRRRRSPITSGEHKV